MAKTKAKTKRAAKSKTAKTPAKRAKRTKEVTFVDDAGKVVGHSAASSQVNPFGGKREARSETKTFRMTRTELDSLNALAIRIEHTHGTPCDAVEAIRQGLGLLMEKYPPPKD